jgi:hypothetical protein
MKLVHSFWSKPMLDNSGKYLVNIGNWMSKPMFYYAITLSSLLMQRYYKGNTVLVTDEFGKQLLIDKLQLPYDEVIVELDNLNEYDKGLWALGKIYAYALMNTPFIHIDFDFFIAREFDDVVSNSPLISYVSEFQDNRQRFYHSVIDNCFNQLVLPQKLRKFFNQPDRIAYNAAVFGGNRLEIFKELWQLSYETIHQNNDRINHLITDSLSSAGFNIIFEQYLFARLAKDYDIPVYCLEDEIYRQQNPSYSTEVMRDFPMNHIHLISESKKDKRNALYLEEILKEEGYEHYKRINHLIGKKQL